MTNTEALLEKFIEKAETEQTSCIKIDKEAFKNILREQNFDFVNLNTPFKSFNKGCEFDEAGIKNAIVGADFAIAETGTSVIDSTDEKIRLATTLAENLFIALHSSNIVAKLENIVSYMNEKNSADNAYLAFITGPSRTADIERVLTIGVHGPVSLTCYIIQDL
ncbi:LUD domain-containing protein [Deferribacteraceae bacterium V6Fe1]|nr:LUD domain-containing protein [Deferribacteraceae bacterium V6Fe1]